MSTDNLMYYQV